MPTISFPPDFTERSNRDRSSFIMTGVGTAVTEQRLGSFHKPNFVPDTRPNVDGSHGNLFNMYHRDENCNVMNDTLEIFSHFSPEKTVHRSPVAALICVYNEEWYSLQRTLDSLAAPSNKNIDFDTFANAVGLDIAIVVDGMEMLKPCMKKYLHTLFGPDIPVDVDEEWQVSHTTMFKFGSHGQFWN